MSIAVIETKHLFAPLHAELIGVLRSLDDAQWHAPTVAGEWRVRDVVAHLLQVDLGRLSAHRDGYTLKPAGPVNSYSEILAIINEANRAGVMAMQRYSPRVLIDLLESSGRAIADFFNTLDPYAPALWAVAWAGEADSANWMDIGREYTERWHHQQQIRDAVGAPLLLARQWAEPLFGLSVRALPRAYAEVSAAPGAAIAIHIEGGGEWSLIRQSQSWVLEAGAAVSPVTEIRATADTAWRIFYNALTPAQARARLRITGDAALANAFLQTRSVMV